MTPDHVRARPPNEERYHSDDDDTVLLSRLRMVIYGIGIAAAFVMITAGRYLGELA